MSNPRDARQRDNEALSYAAVPRAKGRCRFRYITQAQHLATSGCLLRCSSFMVNITLSLEEALFLFNGVVRGSCLVSDPQLPLYGKFALDVDRYCTKENAIFID